MTVARGASFLARNRALAGALLELADVTLVTLHAGEREVVRVQLQALAEAVRVSSLRRG